MNITGLIKTGAGKEGKTTPTRSLSALYTYWWFEQQLLRVPFHDNRVRFDSRVASLDLTLDAYQFYTFIARIIRGLIYLLMRQSISTTYTLVCLRFKVFANPKSHVSTKCYTPYKA